MARSRKRSRSRSRVAYGASGLPLVSSLTASHVNKVFEDDKGNLKQVKRVSGKLVWRKAELKELTQKRSDYYYNQIDNNLDDEDKIRDLLLKVLKEVQPKVTTRA